MSDFYYRGRLTLEADQLDQLTSASFVTCDMESVSLSDMTAIGIGLGVSPTELYYFPIWPNRSEHLELALSKVVDKTVTVCYHNGNGFDLPVLDQLLELEDFPCVNDTNYEDTSIAGQCMGLPGALQRIGEQWFGDEDLFSIQDLFGEYGCRDMLSVPEERVAEKCLNDCRTTFKLWEYVQRELTPSQRDCYETDRRLVSVLRAIEAKGLGLHQGVLGAHQERLTAELDRLRAVCDLEGFNPGSPPQVGSILVSRGNVLPIRRGRLVTDEEALEACPDELAKVVLDYRHSSKLLSSYVEPWVGHPRAYTHFRLDLATGRLASGKLGVSDHINRNLQNVPPGMREVFRADHGIFTWADFGQIELRVLARLSLDRAMMAEYAKEKPDLHGMLANEAKTPHHNCSCARSGKDMTKPCREGGKTFGFARVFGAGDKQLSSKTGVPLAEIPRVRAVMDALFPESSAWIRSQMQSHGDTADTLYGRRMRLPEPKGDENPRAFASHVAKCAVNYPVQGTAADIVKRALLQVHASGADLRLQIHDEYLVDGWWEPDPALEFTCPEIRTPFETKRGPVWT